MNSYKLFLTLFLTLTSYFSYSQIKITGVVKDSLDVIEFANVYLTDLNNKIIVGTITTEKGTFNLSVKEGVYKLAISFIGYEDWSKNISLKNNQDVGIIILNENKSKLNEVVVTANKKLIERKVDRLVFNVGQSIAASGGNAVDALKVAPRVRVQNDAISIIGKSEIRVLVNDRLIHLTGEDLTNFLKNIRADDIKSIEVITNPPAKYEAEGNSGLLNIKLKKAKLNSWNIPIRASYKQATYPTGTIGTGLTYQKNKFSLFSDINYSDGSIAPIKTNKIYYPEQLWDEKNNSRDFKNTLAYKLGGDYQLSKKTKLGLQYIGSISKPKIKEKDITKLTNNVTETLDSLILTEAVNHRKNIYNSFNTHFNYDIDTIGKKLSIDFDYFKYESDDNREFSSNNYFDIESAIPNSSFSAQNNGNQNIYNYSLNIDIEHPLTKVSLNYGGKLSFTNTNNEVVFNNFTSGVSVFDPTQSNSFTYEEKTQTLYASAKKNINVKLEAKIGLRVESTQTKGKSITLNLTNKNSYTEFFPTAYLSYQPNDNNSFSLNYGKRIDRPSFRWLNPFRWYHSNYSFSEGNPQLRPSFTNNIEFEFVHKDNWINNIYFSNLKDGFEYVTIVDDQTNTQMLVAKNFIKTNMIGLYEIVTFKPLKWISTNLAMDIYYSDSKSLTPITNQSLNAWNLESSISNDFILQKNNNILLNVSYTLASDGVDNLDRNTAFSQLDASLKLFLLDKSLQVSLTGNDILRTSRPEFIGVSNNIKTSFKNYYDARYFRVSLVYNIGRKIRVEEREIKNMEEKERTN